MEGVTKGSGVRDLKKIQKVAEKALKMIGDELDSQEDFQFCLEMIAHGVNREKALIDTAIEHIRLNGLKTH